MSCRPCSGTGPVRVGGQRSVTVARPRVGPPPLGRTALPGAEPLTSWQSLRAPAEPWGWWPAPGRPTQRQQKTYPQVRLNLPPGGTLLEQHWSMLSPQLPGVADNGGRSGQRTLDATAGGSTSNSLTSGGRDRELGFKSPARLPGALQALGRKAVGHRGRASPTERVGGPSPPRANDRHSRRPCHLPAISSGHERYIAVSHGHFGRAVPLGTRF